MNQSKISFFYLVSNRDQLFDDINHIIGLVFSRNIFSVDFEDSDIREEEAFSGALGKAKVRDLDNLLHQHTSFQEMKNWMDLGGKGDGLVNSMVNYRKWVGESNQESVSEGDFTVDNISGCDPWDVSVFQSSYLIMQDITRLTYLQVGLVVEIEDTKFKYNVIFSVWEDLFGQEQVYEIRAVMERILNGLLN